MQDYFKKELNKLKCDYWDLRIENTENTSFSIENGELKIQNNYYEGMGIRILNNGSWGFASVNSINKRDFDETVKNALRLSKVKLKENNQIHKYKKQRFKENKFGKKVDIIKWTKRIKELEKQMKHKNIVSTLFVLMNKNSYKTFMNSEDSYIEQNDIFSYGGPRTISKKGEIIQSWTDRKGAIGPLNSLKNLDECAKKAKEKALELLISKPCPKGIKTVILDPHLVGVFCHEAVGHASEADIVSKGDSILEKYQGKVIGNREITIIDSPKEKNGFGNILYDDEGIKGEKVEVIKNGKVMNFMHSRETAKKLGKKPTGNARASGYSSFPQVRMRNTVMLPGKHSKKDIFDIKDGIYLKGMKGGQVKTLDGAFMFAPREGYLIKNGEIKESVRDVSISSDILKILHTVEAIGKDYDPTGVGFCGKGGQSIRAGDGGPHIRVKNMLLG